MNLWLWFWTISLIVSGISFAFITVVVSIKGSRDLQQWFKSLQQQNRD
jgi:hypothetical protein